MARDAVTLARRARGAMLRQSPWFGFLSMRFGDPEITDRIPTAATDGKKLYLNPEWFTKAQDRGGMSDKQRIGLVAHEVGHCALGHLWRRKGRDKALWNQACDHAINLLLLESGFELPEGGLADTRFDKMTAEQIYRILKDEEDANPGTHKQPTLDSHELWGIPQEGEGDGDGDDKKDGNSADGQDGSGGDGKDGDDSDDDFEIAGDGEVDKGSESIAKEWQRAAKEATAACSMAGKLPGRLAHAMEQGRARMPWKQISARWIRRRLGAGYNPDRMDARWWAAAGIVVERYGRPRPRCGAAIDTSMSMPWKALIQCFGEIRGIVDSVGGSQVRVLQHDTEVTFDKELRRGDPMPDKAVGRGGTDFRPILKAAEKGAKIDMLVMFTDCDGPWPEKAPPFPVLVIRFEEISHKMPPTWAQVINVEIRGK